MLILPQVPTSSDGLLAWAQDLVRALQLQLSSVASDSGSSSGSATSSVTPLTDLLGATFSPQLLVLFYNVQPRWDVVGDPTDRPSFLEYFNPGNAGVTYHDSLMVSQINFATSPDALTTKFAAEFRGILHAATQGSYGFGFDVDGTGEVIVDNVVVASRYTAGARVGNLLTYVGAVTLNAGYHNLIVRWVEHNNNGGIQLGWQRPTDGSIAVIGAADLGHYTDIGAEPGTPTNSPGLVTPPTVADTDTGQYTVQLSWTYSQPPTGGTGKAADGFILYYQAGATATPSNGQIQLANTATSYTFKWAKGLIFSYGIAAYRNTVNGQEIGPLVTDPTWQAVTSVTTAVQTTGIAQNAVTTGAAQLNTGSVALTNGSFNTIASITVTLTSTDVISFSAGFTAAVSNSEAGDTIDIRIQNTTDATTVVQRPALGNAAQQTNGNIGGIALGYLTTGLSGTKTFEFQVQPNNAGGSLTLAVSASQRYLEGLVYHR